MIVSDLDSTVGEAHLPPRVQVQHSLLAVLELVGEQGSEEFGDQSQGRPPDCYLAALHH